MQADMKECFHTSALISEMCGAFALRNEYIEGSITHA